MTAAGPPSSFVTHPELATNMAEMKVLLNGLRQDMKGVPIEFGGTSFNV